MYIIFTSAYLEYILEAYKVKTFDFLPKPVTIEKLESTTIRLFEDINNENKKFISIANRIFINENDILYIQKDNMKAIIHTRTKTYTNYTSFSKIEKTLPKNFIRCHKSYIVNTQNISNVDVKNQTISFENKSRCFIGPKYKNTLMEVFYNGNFNCTNYTKSGIN
ncbi:MAG: LytTR family DNA-binding domain-containing protein [Clostridia bacterium]|nr:LytTR family DNA-binding domain-containing protein [Clostridia bacterium]